MATTQQRKPVSLVFVRSLVFDADIKGCHSIYHYALKIGERIYFYSELHQRFSFSMFDDISEELLHTVCNFGETSLNYEDLNKVGKNIFLPHDQHSAKIVDWIHSYLKLTINYSFFNITIVVFSVNRLINDS